MTTSKMVFVFGSNESGVHGAGAAKFAYEKHGARWGKSYGHYGDSFAIPTKDEYIETMKLTDIADYVTGFLAYARGHRKVKFQVTCIGCGLAGLTNEQVAPMFLGAPINCYFDLAWKPVFDELGFFPEYWGTF